MKNIWAFEPSQLSRVAPKTPMLYLRFNIADQTQVVYRILLNWEGW